MRRAKPSQYDHSRSRGVILKYVFAVALTLMTVTNVLSQHGTGSRQYSGPNAVGPIHIDRDTSLRDAFNTLGSSATVKDDHFCYKSDGGTAFLWISIRAHHEETVGHIMLSNFPNCFDRRVQLTSQELHGWKTERGIGLGSTVNEVLQAYRKASVIKIEGNAYRSLIRGDYLINENRYTNRSRTELGEQALAYGNDDDLRFAAFGIRNGKVAWISLGNTE